MSTAPHSATRPALRMSRRKLVRTVIAEMQAELDAFFRSKKSKMVKLSSDDLVYLEVMLAQAVGPLPPSKITGAGADGVLGFCAQRFLREFFMLKTKPQIQMRDSGFKMVKVMVDHTIRRALSQVRKEYSASDASQSEDDIAIPETCSEKAESESEGTAASLSPSESLNVKQEPERTGDNVFSKRSSSRIIQVTSRLFGGARRSDMKSCNSAWLRRGNLEVSASHSTPESPLDRAGRLLSDSSPARSTTASDRMVRTTPRPLLTDEEDAADCLLAMQKRLPIKKRKPSSEAVVPDKPKPL